MMTNTGMEYTDGLMEMYITDSGNRIRKMDKDIPGGQMAVNIGESTRMTRNGERESNNRTEYYTMSNTKKASSSAGLKYSEVLDFKYYIIYISVFYVIYKHSKLYITLSR
jgi:hypothetical protein